MNYRRRDALARVLQEATCQEYPHLRILVIDNNSGDGTVEWIREQYPSVEVAALSENFGTVARNHGFTPRDVDIVVTLDNDVYFDSPQEVARIVKAFERHPQAACIAFRVYHPELGALHARDWCHPRSWETSEHLEFPTYFITEGASAFRRSVFDSVDPYWQLLFIGNEGYDLALRLMDAGYEIWYIPDVKVWHMAALDETRPNWRPFYYNTRNLILIAYRNFPFLGGVLMAGPRIGVLGFYALRHHHFRRFLSGIWDGLRSYSVVLPLRRRLKNSTLNEVAAMRKQMPSFFKRFLRHWKKLEF
ncbi:MAG: glycosyltransferase family 2 protein [Bryobacteraceae bacterium]|nr:glycosyltransferase family 2 protein [Bryobacteraceae bacterium]